MLDIMALELILLVLIDVRCTHSHFKEYKLKGNEFFFFFLIQREIELAHYTLATLW